MKTLLCYAFVVQPSPAVWDLCDRLASAEIDYLHDCETGRVLVRMDDAVRADGAVREAGLVTEGRMTSIPESDWLSLAALELPLDPADIDWDPREEWCAGAPPRITL